jgi:hypothetical protein
LDLSLSATLDTATLPVVFWINAREAWDRGTAEPGSPARARKRGTSPSWGLYPDPYHPTPAEQVLNPTTADDDED